MNHLNQYFHHDRQSHLWRRRVLGSFSLLILFLLAPQVYGQDPALFPRPAELEPAINFWVRVYTEVDTQSGFLHDSQHLDVVYVALPLNRSAIEARRSHIQEDLRVLATGKRDQLTRTQRETLALWPEDVSNQTLRTAASNVRWQLGQSDRFLGGLQRSGAYRAHIDNVIREKELPKELGVLPHVESSFNPGAFSSASAAGMWQFGRATGQRFMRIDHIVDDRMDPYTATSAAMSLLEYNYSVLGTWPLALTAYNHGAGGIARAVRETGTTDIEKIIANYRGRAFGFASRNFYAQFLAVIQVENNASQYFGEVRFSPAPRFREVETDSFIDAEVFARSIGISVEQLRADNRGLRPVVWEGNKRIPAGYKIKVREEVFPTGDILAMVPSDYKFPVQTPDIAYVVERGDSLSVIARRFNTSVAQLASLNQLPSRNRIQIGQRLLLPQDYSPGTQVAPVVSAEGTYTVSRGDTVSLIAARYGVTEQALLGINGIQDPHRIYPGQQLTMPGYVDAGIQVAAIEATSTPTPPVQIQFEDEVVEPSEPEARELEIGSLEEETEQLTLERLPPAAVLPDNQELDTPVTAQESAAEALDPVINVSESNEQLVENLSADPSDYSVASNNTVEVQASETLGHFAEWLGVRAWDVRRLNNMAFRDPVIVGKRLTLDFSRVNIAEFELKRREFHSGLQQEFFSNYRIQGVEQYQVQRGDNIGAVARTRYSTPIWLLRQYNPELDFNRIQIGQQIVFPLLEQTE
ncbi:MAG: LysM peptidoglycan-binding domain-containing protein [Pseudohongiellaceae bacterium]